MVDCIRERHGVIAPLLSKSCTTHTSYRGSLFW